MLSVVGGAAGVCIATWGGQLLRALFLSRDTTLPVFTDGRTLAFAGAREGTYQRSRTRGLLVVVQGALSVVLLVGAGLFVRSLRNVQSMRLGFDIDPVVLVARNMRSVSMSDTAQAALSERMLEAAKVFPGVEAASRALTVPMQQTWSVGVDAGGPLPRKASAQRMKSNAGAIAEMQGAEKISTARICMICKQEMFYATPQLG